MVLRHVKAGVMKSMTIAGTKLYIPEAKICFDFIRVSGCSHYKSDRTDEINSMEVRRDLRFHGGLIATSTPPTDSANTPASPAACQAFDDSNVINAGTKLRYLNELLGQHPRAIEISDRTLCPSPQN